MPIVKRSYNSPSTYVAFREYMWEKQGRDKYVNFDTAKMRDGSKLDGVYLHPKPILHYKDVWLCPNLADAKRVARTILTFDDVIWIELKGQRFVFVDYTKPEGFVYSHVLPGQGKDVRKLLRK